MLPKQFAVLEGGEQVRQHGFTAISTSSGK